jgi:hypothetical protein
MVEAIADPLIQKAVDDWRRVSKGAKLDDFHADLLALVKRDDPTGTGNSYKAQNDFETLNAALYEYLPNIKLVGADEKDVLVTDPMRTILRPGYAPIPQMGVLREDHGLLREEDLDMDTLIKTGKFETKPTKAEPLFDHPNSPELDITPGNAKQGAKIGDCHFTAALSSLATEDKDAIKNMVKANPDGTYTVTFADDKDHPVVVGAPNEWELETFAEKRGGIWANIVEKAYRKRVGMPFNPPEGGSSLKDDEMLTGKKGMTLLGNSCGWPGSWFDGWFGSQITCGENHSGTSLPDLLKGNPNAQFIAVSPYDVARLASEALADHQLVQASTKRDLPDDARGTDPQGRRVFIEPRHAYTVIGADPNAGTITLRNPHGSNRDENGTEVGDGTVVVDASLFSISAAFMGIVVDKSAKSAPD